MACQSRGKSEGRWRRCGFERNGGMSERRRKRTLVFEGRGFERAGGAYGEDEGDSESDAPREALNVCRLERVRREGHHL